MRTIVALLLLALANSVGAADLAGKLFIDVGVQPASVKCDRRDPGPDGRCWIQCGRLAFIGNPITAPDGASGEWRWRALCRQMRRLFIEPLPTPGPEPTARPTASPRPTATPFPINQTPCERGEKGWCLVWSPTTFNTVCVRCNL